MTTLQPDDGAVREIEAGAARPVRPRLALPGPGQRPRDGKPHAINAFGTKLVVFADGDGELNVLDGYCRHLGGDLSQGTVKGDEIACPFHDWRWGGDGRCKLVPYAKRVPKLARTRSWDRRAADGLLFVWHDPEGNPPQPEVPHSGDRGRRQRRVDRLDIGTRC